MSGEHPLAFMFGPGGPGGGPPEPEKPRLPPEMQARVLLDHAAQYHQNMKRLVKVGELITPTHGGLYAFPLPGEPALVVEVLEKSVRDHHVSSDSPFFGLSLDVRVMVLTSNGVAATFMVHRGFFGPYEGSAA